MDEVKTNSQMVVAELATLTVITNDDGLNQADKFLALAVKTMKEIDLAHDDDISHAHNTHKMLLAEKKKFYDPVNYEAKRIKLEMARYRDEIARKAAEERRRLEAEARKAEEDRQLSEAIEAENLGNTAHADAIIEEKINIAPVRVPPPPKTDARFRTVWKFRVVDPGVIPIDFMIPDEKKIGEVVRSSKGEIAIPGVKIWSETV